MNFEDMTEEQLLELIAQASKENETRKTRAAFDREVAEKIATYRHDAGITHTDGDEWVKPKGLNDSYLEGEILVNGGVYWRSLVTGNVCVPQDEVPPPEGCGSWERTTPPTSTGTDTKKAKTAELTL